MRIIRASKTPSDAQRNLERRFELDELQSKAIVDMRLAQLTGLRMDQLHAEYDELLRQISYLQSILDDPELCKKVMKDELLEVKDKYNDPRRTEIKPYEHEFNAEDFYPNDPVVITVSHLGYIKRTPLSEFREQARGGVGSKGAESRISQSIYILPPCIRPCCSSHAKDAAIGLSAMRFLKETRTLRDGQFRTCLI